MFYDMELGILEHGVGLRRLSRTDQPHHLLLELRYVPDALSLRRVWLPLFPQF